jgi:hypothetical protein
LLISTASIAGELTVTGNAKASFQIVGSDNAAANEEAGRALTIENSIVLGASGELDNGTAWKYSFQLDAGSVDDPSITLSNNLGTIGLFASAGGLNAKHYGSANAVAYGSQYGRGNTTGEFQDPSDIGGVSNIQYHTPAGLLPFGTVLKVAKGFAGSATAIQGDAIPVANTKQNAMNYSIDIAPLDGLGIQATYYNEEALSTDTDSGQELESGALGVKYALGNFTLGYVKAVHVPSSGATVATYNRYDNDSYSIGFKVNDNLSLSYGKEESERNTTTDATANVTAEIDVIQAAYTMGGLTLGASVKGVDNYSYTATNDVNEATLFLTLAF